MESLYKLFIKANYSILTFTIVQDVFKSFIMSKRVFKIRSVLKNFERKYSNKSKPELPACNHTPHEYKGPNYEQLKNIRGKNLWPALTTYYSKPLAIYQGHMQWLYDIQGRRYLDMFGGIATVSVGHGHPKISTAVYEQISKLGHCSNVYLHPAIHEYAEQLTAKLPGDLKVVYFVNSGSEANDLATLLARSYTGNFDIVSLRNGYHGMSYQTMGLSNMAPYRYPVAQPTGTHQTMNPDVFRGPWGGSACRDSPIQTVRNCLCFEDTCEAKDKYVEQLSDLYLHCLPKGNVAAFFAEAIQGVGGTVQYPKGYIKGAFDLINQNGGLFVADEVQTGFGRTGDHYWGFQMHDIQPDIVTMAKGIGNGFPLGAVVTTPEIAKGLSKASHFNTFGGNPVACAAGKAVLEIIEEEKCQEISKEIGTYLLEKLAKLRDAYKIVGDVRGKGLMIGVELTLGDGSVKALPPQEFMEIWENCLDMGLIVGKGGVYGNVLRIKPPMCITKQDADFTVAVLDRALEMHLDKHMRNERVYISGI